jgi:hypothetical protein
MAARRQRTPIGLWPRCSRYEISDGYIVPTRDAKLTWYDPWHDFLATRRDHATAEAAYDELLRLLDSVAVRMLSVDEVSRVARGRSKAGAVLRPTFVKYTFDERAVLAWVRKHGLLGLLHHGLEAAYVYRQGVVSSFVSWSRGSWRVVENQIDARSRERLRATSQARGELSDSYAVVRPLAAPAAEARRLPIAWEPYFPTLRDEELSRVPATLVNGSAWQLYCESVDEFIDAAVSIRSMLAALRGPKKRGFDANAGLVFLEELLIPVRRTFRVDAGGALEPAWASPSLVGYLGAMIFDDVTREGRVAACARCGRPRVSRRALYCSASCKKAGEMARYRARLKTR